MADGRETLELGPEDELEDEIDEGTEDEDQDEGGDEAGDEEGEEDEESETVIGFEGEEAAPASEGDESSVIRELRRVNREQAKRLAQLESGTAPKKIEVGEKPTLEACEYDEERFDAEYEAWTQRKAAAAREDREAQERTETERQQWTERAQAYEVDKQRLNVAGYDDAEGEVFSTLSAETQALIMLTEKPAALIYALSRNPAKLAELSKLDLARAAMMIGKLEEKVQVTKRKLPDPDRPVRGNAAPANADKTLARLEAEAERTGDRTELRKYRQKLRKKA